MDIYRGHGGAFVVPTLSVIIVRLPKLDVTADYSRQRKLHALSSRLERDLTHDHVNAEYTFFSAQSASAPTSSGLASSPSPKVFS